MFTYWFVAAFVATVSWLWLKSNETWVEPAVGAIAAIVLGLLWFIAIPVLLGRIAWVHREGIKAFFGKFTIFFKKK